MMCLVCKLYLYLACMSCISCADYSVIFWLLINLNFLHCLPKVLMSALPITNNRLLLQKARQIDFSTYSNKMPFFIDQVCALQNITFIVQHLNIVWELEFTSQQRVV